MKVVIALGSNIGDTNSHLHHAVAELGKIIEVSAVSSFYKTTPVGGPPQNDYLNAVLIGRSDMDPLDLLIAMQEIETLAGRTRDIEWGPRTLDLDLITFGELVLTEPHLELPHPRAHERTFVLEPWLEIEPEAQLPVHGSALELLRTLKH
jgi:2-amino-4-hydroxy-6-hydroxymethyldihydropteridine diphosphokinase